MAKVALKEVEPIIPKTEAPKPMDFSQFDKLATKDDHKAFSGKRGGNDRYAIDDKLVAYIQGKIREMGGKAVFPTDAVKQMTQYKGKATMENFIYGLQEALKRYVARKQVEDAKFTLTLRAGIRDAGKKVVFYNKK